MEPPTPKENAMMHNEATPEIQAIVDRAAEAALPELRGLFKPGPQNDAPAENCAQGTAEAVMWRWLRGGKPEYGPGCDAVDMAVRRAEWAAWAVFTAPAAMAGLT